MSAIVTRCGRANLAWDAAHRVLGHESKCRALHGHRYSATVIAEATELDEVGRVVDFGVIKGKVGRWVDENLDHAAIVNPKDDALLAFVREESVKPPFVMPQGRPEPTAENIAAVLFELSSGMLRDDRIRVLEVIVYETPNCFASVSLTGAEGRLDALRAALRGWE